MSEPWGRAAVRRTVMQACRAKPFWRLGLTSAGVRIHRCWNRPLVDVRVLGR
jgi:hypothetical protein